MSRPRPEIHDAEPFSSALELCFVLSPHQNAFFVELAQALVDEVSQMGVNARVDRTGFPHAHWGTVFVLLPPHEYVALTGFTPLDHPEVMARTIVICAEQPDSSFFESNVRIAASAGAIFDLNPRAIDAFRQRGLEARHLRLGYTRLWDRNVAGNFDEGRPLEVLFLGAATTRRLRSLAGCAEVLWRRQSHVVLSATEHPHEEGAANFFAGSTKLDLLRRTQTVLNVHRGDEPYFEWLRIIEAMHGGAVVVTESSTGFQPLVAGEHFISARQESLGYVLEAALDDAELLSRIRRSAYEWLRSEPLAASAMEIVATASELLNQPVPSTDGLVHSNENPARPVFQPAAVSESIDAGVIRRTLKELRLDLLEVRRQLRELRGAADSSADDRSPQASESYRWSERPRVSVVTALYNHAEFIEEAIESVRRSDYRSVELIVVDDASTDRSAAVVRDYMHREPDLALLLLRHASNLGVGHARNTAIDAARGEFIFVLDADNRIYSTALGALVKALDADEGAAGAYGMIQCFTADGPERCASYLPWEPERLRAGNYIDAMAMTRASVLRKLGGFTTDRRLYGWEDYDLWCGMAEADQRLILIPNFIGAYRVSGTSMLATSDIAHFNAYAALTERHPELMAGVVPPQ
jgi:GT2 family glycosyltransferase